MGGVGITFKSKPQGQPAAPSAPLTSLPRNVVEEIARTLSIQTDETKAALRQGKLEIPDNVEVTITRNLTKESLTLKKVGGAFELTFKEQTSRIVPTAD